MTEDDGNLEKSLKIESLLELSLYSQSCSLAHKSKTMPFLKGNVSGLNCGF